MNELIELAKKCMKNEKFSYLVFGGLTTVVDLIVFFLFGTTLGVEYHVSKVIAWIAAVTFAYITNKLFVFNSRSVKDKSLIKELVSFYVSRIISLLVQLALISVAVEFFKMNKNIANILTSVVVVILNYVLSKLFVFKKEKI